MRSFAPSSKRVAIANRDASCRQPPQFQIGPPHLPAEQFWIAKSRQILRSRQAAPPSEVPNSSARVRWQTKSQRTLDFLLWVKARRSNDPLGWRER